MWGNRSGRNMVKKVRKEDLPASSVGLSGMGGIGNPLDDSFLNMSAISLDGKSLLLPPDHVRADEYGFNDSHDQSNKANNNNNKNLDHQDEQDEVSSINSSVYRPYAGSTLAEVKIIARSPVAYTEAVKQLYPTTPSPSSNQIRKKRWSQPRDLFASAAAPKLDSHPTDLNEKKLMSLFCLPSWMQRAPLWLRLIFAASVVLLLVALALVAVALSMAVTNKNNHSAAANDAASNQQQGGSTPMVPLPAPVQPVTAPVPTPVDLSPTVPQPVVNPVAAPVDVPQPAPTTASETVPAPPTPTPSLRATQRPTVPKTQLPTETVDPDLVTFYVTAGRYSLTTWATAQTGLSRLPTWNKTAFLVHLGDWNDPTATHPTTCSAPSFQSISQLFGKSTVPVYFVPGANESTACPDPSLASNLFARYVQSPFEGSPPWTVWRASGVSTENFSFNYKEIAFCSVDFVSTLNATDSSDPTQFQTVLAVNLQWIDETYRYYKKSSQVMVIFANAGPPGQSLLVQQFYNGLLAKIRDNYSRTSFVLIHQTAGGSPLESTAVMDPNMLGLPNLSVISVTGGRWPPQRIQIDTSNKNYNVILDTDDWSTSGASHRAAA